MITEDAKKQREIIAKNLNRYIHESGKMQKEIAKDLNISPTTFNMWCKGNTMPPVSKIQMLAEYFHIAKSDLVDEKHLSSDEATRDLELLAKFSRLEDHEKRIIEEMITVLINNRKSGE